MQAYSYLALGDSYTIGESVLLTENFPYQTVQLLRKSGIDIQAPEIIAKTGWTTDELQDAMAPYHFREQYDFVSLLIGVNNQYRGRSADEYAIQFRSLLQKAIALAGGRKNRVVVLSIPDWGVTPFAEGRDRAAIAREIDIYNKVNREISAEAGVHYIDITPGTREASHRPELVAADGLHPSPIDYARWAAAVAAFFRSAI